MSYIATFNEHGEILQSIICPEDDLQYYNNFIFLQSDDVIEQDQYYIPDINNPVKTLLTGRPSDYHQYDYVNKQWVILDEYLDTSKIDKKNEINNTMNKLRFAIIVYDGKNLDVDVTAQTNISGKIAQIQNEIALSVPSTDLVWKDADNVVHTWISVNAYLEWLQGLQIAIAHRTSALYQTIWTGKAAVDALSNVQEVIDYDVNALFGIQ